MPLRPTPEKGEPQGDAGIRLEDCWAKTTKDGRPGISVRDHCLNVGCVAEVLLRRLLPSIRSLLPIDSVATLAALHDLGKVSPGFQQKCEEWTRQYNHRQDVFEGNHPRITQDFIENLTPDGLRSWAEALGAHHGRVQGPAMGDTGDAAWEMERQRLLEELVRLFGKLPNADVTAAREWLFAGLVAVADWLGSDEGVFPATRSTSPLSRDDQQAVAESTVKRLNLVVEAPKAGLGFGDLFLNESGPLSPNPLQRCVIENVKQPGLYVVEGMMGCGKTEAAFWAAYGLISSGQATGMYFALPTQTTSNRIYLRAKEFLARAYGAAPMVRLAHGNSWLSESDGESPLLRGSCEQTAEDKEIREARSWFASSRRALLAPYAVGTVDQALLGVVAAKHFFVRQFALAGKVVVLDEVHSYDLYTGTLINALIERLLELKGTVVILSATLTARQRARLLGDGNNSGGKQPYPLLSMRRPPGDIVSVQIEGEDEEKRLRVHCVPTTSDSCTRLAKMCVDHARRGQCVVWIRNTVADAQESYRAVCNEVSQEECANGLEIGLLHARFPYFIRERHEDHWLGLLDKSGKTRPKGCVLVATQVVEQSVDIDTDFMVTDLAPTDMLLQRIGRLHRHNRPGRRMRPRVVICFPADLEKACNVTAIREALGSTGRVYARYVLLRTLQQWRMRPALSLPSDIREILEGTYADPDPREPQAWKELFAELEQRKGMLESRAFAAMNVRGQDLLEDEEGVQTRYSDQPQLALLIVMALREHSRDKVEVRLLNGDRRTAQTRRFDMAVARSLHKNIVKIPSWWLRGIDFRSFPALNAYFREKMALALLEGEELLIGGQRDLPVRLRYRPDLGVWAEKTPPTPAPTQTEDDLESCE